MCRTIRYRRWLVVGAALVVLGTASWCTGAKPVKLRSWIVADVGTAGPMALSRDGKTLVSMAQTRGGLVVIEARDTLTGRRLWSQQVGRALVNPFSSLAISPDQTLLAHTLYAFLVSPITLRETKRGTVVHELGTGDGQRSMQFARRPGGLAMPPGLFTKPVFSPAGDLLAATSQDKPNEMNLWDTKTGRHLGKIAVGDHTLSAVYFSPDGRWMAALAQPARIEVDEKVHEGGGRSFHTRTTGMVGDPILYVWDTKTRRELAATKLAHRSAGRRDLPAFSPDGTLFAYQEIRKLPDDERRYDIGVCVRETLTGQQRARLPMRVAEVLRFARDGKTFFGTHAVSAHLSVEVGNLETGEVTQTMNEQPEGRLLLVTAFSPSGEIVAVGGGHHAIELWRTRTGRTIATLQGPRKGFVSYALDRLAHGQEMLFFSGDGSRLASVAAFGKARRGRPVENGSTRVTVWNVAEYTGEETPR